MPRLPRFLALPETVGDDLADLPQCSRAEVLDRLAPFTAKSSADGVLVTWLEGSIGQTVRLVGLLYLPKRLKVEQSGPHSTSNARSSPCPAGSSRPQSSKPRFGP